MNNVKERPIDIGKRFVFEGIVIERMLHIFPDHYKVEVDGHIFKLSKEFLEKTEKRR